MKAHPRIRKCVKWGGAAAGLLFVAAWITSIWWTTLWVSGWNFDFFAGFGVFGFGTGPHDNAAWWPAGWQVNRRQGQMQWWFYWRGLLDSPYRYAWMPLWVPACLAAGCSAIAWRMDVVATRRSRVGTCARCGYDRIGLKAETACPECGDFGGSSREFM